MRKHGAEVPNAEQAFGERCERRSHLGPSTDGEVTMRKHGAEVLAAPVRTLCVSMKPK